MDLWLGALNLGLLYAFMAAGVFVTFRIFDFADITVDGSFTTGGAVAAVLLVQGYPLSLALAAALAAGALAGAATGFIHTRFQVNGLLAGILVMTGLYSVNLRIMGRANIPLMKSDGFPQLVERWNPSLPAEVWLLVVLSLLITLFWLVAALFFRTDLGITMRATGNSPTMAAAQGVSAGRMKLLGIALANALVALSGALVVQYQGFADIGMGIGAVVFSLAAVIIGEALFRFRSTGGRILAVIAGSVIFRLMVALALVAGLDPNDLKLITAGFVLLALIAGRPSVWAALARHAGGPARRWRLVMLLALAAAGGTYGVIQWTGRDKPAGSSTGFPAEKNRPERRVVIFQFSDMPLLEDTVHGAANELQRQAAVAGLTLHLERRNAHGDFPTGQTIAKELAGGGFDLILTVSTIALQAVAAHNRSTPHVFAAVTDPVKAGVISSFTGHPPHLTGLATPQPVAATIALLRRLFPSAKTIGILYNPSEANSEICTAMAREAATRYGFRLLERTVAGPNEVEENFRALLRDEPDLFLTSGDVTVNTATPVLAKTLRQRKIPYATNNPPDIRHGVLLTLGADYRQVGEEAARLAARILTGENPAAIPVIRFTPENLGLNLRLAREYGLTIPEEIRQRAATVEKAP